MCIKKLPDEIIKSVPYKYRRVRKWTKIQTTITHKTRITTQIIMQATQETNQTKTTIKMPIRTAIATTITVTTIITKKK